MRAFASPTAVLGVIGSLAAWALLSISPAVAQAPRCAGLAVTIPGGTNGNDALIEGTDGDDVIHGRAGNDTIFGRGGNDTICGGAGADRILGGDGDDLILGGTETDLIRGDPGNDRIEAGPGNDLALGGIGNDDVRGQGGDDRLSGGVDNDTVLGGPGNDALGGDDGDDTIRGGDGDDDLLGGRGAMSGADSVFGEGGSDLLVTIDTIPDDRLDGGLGDNTCVFDSGDTVLGVCFNPLLASQQELAKQVLETGTNFELTAPTDDQKRAIGGIYNLTANTLQ